MSAAPLEWRKTRITAYLWWCGDYECNCTQPLIEEISPNLDAGYPWVRRKTLWKGTYRSDALLSELQDQERELKTAAQEHGLTIETALSTP